jgi:hypothetical protein
MDSACGMHRRDRKCIRVRKVEEKRPLGRPRPRWEDNIKTNFKKLVGVT